MSLEENESGSELCAEDQMLSDLETDNEWIDPSPSSPSNTPQHSASSSKFSFLQVLSIMSVSGK